MVNFQTRQPQASGKLALACAFCAALLLHVGVIAAMLLSPLFAFIADKIAEDNALEISLAQPVMENRDLEPEPLNPAERKVETFIAYSSFPTDAADRLQMDFKSLNGFSDTEDGGSKLGPDGPRSGGGGGDGADSKEFGHVAADDKLFARMNWKSDPGAAETIAGDDSGRGQTIPGLLKRPGAGSGLGNGRGSGALASSGSGTGSGAGENGSNIGRGLGKAPPLGATRRPEVLKMNLGVYPPDARNSRHQGTTVLNVEILPTGALGRVEVRTTSGYTELDQAALSAIRDWQFTGALKDGDPVAFWFAIPFRFVLHEE